MKILLTGGTGTLGKELGKELVRRGHEITLLTRQKAELVKLNIPYPCDVLIADLNKAVLSISQSFDAVIHLAGESIAGARWTKERKKRLFESRILTTKNLVESLKSNPPSVFISASGIGFYGDRGDESLNEESSPGNDFLAQICIEWEKEALKIKSEKTRVVLARIAAVLNLQEGALPEMATPFRMGAAAVLGSGNQWMSWIHVKDLMRGLIHALETSSLSGPVNMTAPKPVTNRELSVQLAKSLRVPLLLKSPRFVLRFLFGEKATVILNSQRAVSHKLSASGFEFEFSNIEKALNDLCSAWARGEDVFITEQFFYASKENLFKYFCDAKNLETITPPHLNFHIEKISTPEIQKGTLIDYSLKLYGVPLKWRTLISEWNPPHQFADQQLKGPYSLWDHTHRFESLGPGTLMTDTVRYKVPLKYLGRLTAGAWVARDVQKIFQYRRETIGKMNF
jgi:uncharacterized protein (TIGR01777 family)